MIDSWMASLSILVISILHWRWIIRKLMQKYLIKNLIFYTLNYQSQMWQLLGIKIDQEPNSNKHVRSVFLKISTQKLITLSKNAF